MDVGRAHQRRKEMGPRYRNVERSSWGAPSQLSERSFFERVLPGHPVLVRAKWRQGASSGGRLRSRRLSISFALPPSKAPAGPVRLRCLRSLTSPITVRPRRSFAFGSVIRI